MSMSPLTHADNPDDLNPTAPRQGNLETTQ